MHICRVLEMTEVLMKKITAILRDRHSTTRVHQNENTCYSQFFHDSSLLDKNSCHYPMTNNLDSETCLLALHRIDLATPRTKLTFLGCFYTLNNVRSLPSFLKRLEMWWENICMNHKRRDESHRILLFLAVMVHICTHSSMPPTPTLYFQIYLIHPSKPVA